MSREIVFVLLYFYDYHNGFYYCLQEYSYMLTPGRANYRYFIDLSFNGTAYHGWQVQPNAISVQQMLAEALATLLKEDTELTGSGRTDTGVHALNYTAHFQTLNSPEQINEMDLVYKLNRILPHDIAIQQIRQVKPDAHARFSALSRSYDYIICRKKDPFMVNRAWLMERPLDYDSMQEVSQKLLQYEDFESFSRSNTQVNNYLCNVSSASWRQEGHLWIFNIEANRFLRNMVRAIVGTLADVGLKKISPSQFDAIVESKNRSNAGYSVPGCGLYFLGAEYEDGIFVK